MAYSAQVYRILLASPGDVGEERDAVEAELVSWGRLRSGDTGVLLQAVRWETDVMPELGDRPQAIINRQIGDACDAVIAIFWTRLGTSTGVAVSGSVEEIERAVKAGKQVLLYFSRRPVDPSQIDHDQHKALGAFKQDYLKLGIAREFASVDEFRRLLRDDLERLAQRVLASESAKMKEAATQAQHAVESEVRQQEDVLARLQRIEEKFASMNASQPIGPTRPPSSLGAAPTLGVALAELAAMVRNNFVKAQHRSRWSEAKANLLAGYTAYKAFIQKHDRFPSTLAEAGFAPASGTRYAYFGSYDDVVGGDGDNNREQLIRDGRAEMLRRGLRPHSGKIAFELVAVGRGLLGAGFEIWTIDDARLRRHVTAEEGEQNDW